MRSPSSNRRRFGMIWRRPLPLKAIDPASLLNPADHTHNSVVTALPTRCRRADRGRLEHCIKIFGRHCCLGLGASLWARPPYPRNLVAADYGRPSSLHRRDFKNLTGRLVICRFVARVISDGAMTDSRLWGPISSHPEAPLTTIFVFGCVSPAEVVSHSMRAGRCKAGIDNGKAK